MRYIVLKVEQTHQNIQSDKLLLYVNEIFGKKNRALKK